MSISEQELLVTSKEDRMFPIYNQSLDERGEMDRDCRYPVAGIPTLPAARQDLRSYP